MDTFGLNDKWAYRDVASGNCYGMSESRVVDICRTADVFINISCSTYMRDDYLRIPKRILIDSDPMFTQIQHALRLESETISTNWSTRQMFEIHNYLFTFGENIGKDSCRIPTFDYRWLCTRQPVCLNLWMHNGTKSGRSFTSVMNWSERTKIEYNAELWGQKDVEFAKIKDLPKYLPHSSFDIVLNNPPNTGNGLIESELNTLGWRIHDPEATVKNHTDYRVFILQSMAEFSVAKETYVKSNSGWFSCRSACYLAAGKPVITQEQAGQAISPLVMD